MIATRNGRGPNGLLLAAPLAAALISAGCGGSGTSGGTTAPVGGGQTANAGIAKYSFVGQPQPLAATVGPINVFSQAGASFTSFACAPQSTLASTYLLFSRQVSAVSGGAGNPELYSIPATGGGTPTLLHLNADSPTVSTTGTIAFWNSITAGVETIRPDGSGDKPISGLFGGGGRPAISPNGTQIVFEYKGNLYLATSAGAQGRTIYSTGNVVDGTPIVWSPNGTQIAFTATVGGLSQPYTMTIPATGLGTVTNVTPTSWAKSNLTVTSWSPDGTLLAGYGPNGATPISYNVNITFSATGGAYVGQLSYNTEAWNETDATFSPDGHEVAFYRSGSNPSGIYIENADGTNLQFVLSDPPSSGTSGGLKQLVWAPFQASQTFVGTGGTLSTAPVSGFLLTEGGSQFASLLTFVATTPSKGTVTAPFSTTTGSPLVYTLAADAITNISYTNAYYGAVTSLTLSATPTALVTIDATTGQVDLVVSALAFKSVPAASRDAGPVVTYTGKITAIYDGTGKNLAPSGAKTVSINRLTGKLDSFE